MTKQQLDRVRIEYELTDASLQSLKDRYNDPLEGSDKWEKKFKPAEVVIPQPIQQHIVQPMEQPIGQPTDILEDISTFKQKAVKVALDFMDEEYIDLKRFKDIVSVVDSIEKSYKTHQPENNVNIVIQNLVQGFKDDC